jgi:superfamily I DNA/RNA helicase
METESRVNIILGPPGTGKTTTLLNIVDEAIESGIPPERIAYLAFTRKAGCLTSGHFTHWLFASWEFNVMR